MSNDYYEIMRLLHLYCRYFDLADFKSYANLFAHGRMVFGGPPDTVFDRDPEGIEAFVRELTIIYEDGTPNSRHVSSNAIIDIDPSGSTATCESYMTVFQGAEGLPLQAIATGLDRDRFEKVKGEWRFTERIATAGPMGNMNFHTRSEIFTDDG